MLYPVVIHNLIENSLSRLPALIQSLIVEKNANHSAKDLLFILLPSIENRQSKIKIGSLDHLIRAEQHDWWNRQTDLLSQS